MSHRPTRPVLRYHGGKWRLAPWIISHFPAHRVYVEPFGGAASVLLRKSRVPVEVYNDLDGEVVNLFRVLRDAAGAERLAELIRLTPFSREEFRNATEPSDDPVEQGRRTMVRAWLGFGSGGLTHNAGLRVAYSERRHTAKEWASFASVIPRFAERFAGVFVENRSAEAVMYKYAADDSLVYLDPPYVETTRGPRHRYRHELSDEAHAHLAAAAASLPGAVVVSGYDSPLYAELYSGWTIRRRRAIDALSRDRVEVLWLNPRCAEALAQAGVA